MLIEKAETASSGNKPDYGQLYTAFFLVVLFLGWEATPRCVHDYKLSRERNYYFCQILGKLDRNTTRVRKSFSSSFILTTFVLEEG
jgi:hypothetical protein